METEQNEKRKRPIASVQIDIGRFNSEMMTRVLLGGLSEVGKWAMEFGRTLANPRAENANLWALELLEEAEHYRDVKAEAGRMGGRPKKGTGSPESAPTPPPAPKPPAEPEIKQNETNAKADPNLCFSTPKADPNLCFSTPKADPKHTQSQTEQTDRQTDRMGNTPTSKDVGQAAEAAAPLVKPIFTQTNLGSAEPAEHVREILALGNFQAMKFDQANPSKTWLKVSTLLREIHSGRFMTAHQWDRTWLNGRGRTLAEIPGVPHGTESMADYTSGHTALTWPQVVAVFRNALEGVAEAAAKGSPYPKDGAKIGLADFILNDRDPKACTSPLVGFAYAKSRAPHETDAAKIMDNLAPKVLEKGELLLQYHRAEGGQALQGRALATFWRNVRALCEWHGRNVDGLRANRENRPEDSDFNSVLAKDYQLLAHIRKAYEDGAVCGSSTCFDSDGTFMRCPESAEQDKLPPAQVSWRWDKFRIWIGNYCNCSLETKTPKAAPKAVEFHISKEDLEMRSFRATANALVGMLHPYEDRQMLEADIEPVALRLRLEKHAEKVA